RTPRTQTTDNGKQNTYFSSLDNMVAQGNVLPVLYGEMRVGHVWHLRRSARQMKGMVVRLW
ncbi:putative tail assembly protein, partial [Escherichia coli O104:H4 str. 01-09591]